MAAHDLVRHRHNDFRSDAARPVVEYAMNGG